MAGEQRRRRLRALLDLADVPAEALDRIDAAFVHESAAKEQQMLSNERLEFLGDAVLGLTVARWLYATYPDEKEGTLAKRKAAIVSDLAIAQTARRLGFGELVQLGVGERAHGGSERTSILADAFEAFVAVLYLEHGFPLAQRFVEHEHIAHVDHSRVFTSTVTVNRETLGTGTGPSKKAAQQNAAAQALLILQERLHAT